MHGRLHGALHIARPLLCTACQRALALAVLAIHPPRRACHLPTLTRPGLPCRAVPWLQIMSEIQRTWAYLESLFIHSEEVKKELPEATIRFANIDKEVKEVLVKFGELKNAVECCNREGLMKHLEKQQRELEICEKALADYMESKRRAFPRFYFVSTADLLDILSNGNNPVKVMTHMSKCFQVRGGAEARALGALILMLCGAQGDSGAVPCIGVHVWRVSGMHPYSASTAAACMLARDSSCAVPLHGSCCQAA